MKNQSFLSRLKYAINGVWVAWHGEASFRLQVVFGVFALAFLAVFGAPLIWWAIFIMIIFAILAAEMLNTALEKMADKLEPRQDPLVAIAKDCAAGAVLLLSLASLILFCLFLAERFLP